MNRQVTNSRKLFLPVLLGLLTACGDQPTGTNLSNGPVSLAIVSGNSQTGLVGEQLPEAVVVRVTTASGSPVANQIVNFRVTAGGGSVFAGAALTNANGIAQERWTLGSAAGENRMEARAIDSSTGERLVFATFAASGVTQMPNKSQEGADPPGATGTPSFSFSSVSADSFTVTAAWTEGANARSYRWTTGSESGSPWGVSGTSTAGSISFRAPRVSSNYWFCVQGFNASDSQGPVACNRFTAPVYTAPTPVVSTVTLSPSSVSIQSGASSQLTATARNAAGTTVSRSFTWTSSNPNVATVTSTGLVRGVAAGTATITATTDGRSGTRVVTVTAPPAPAPAPSPSGSAEPAGFTRITERSFSALNEDGWSDSNGRTATLSLANDGTAPRSGGSVGVITFPQGYTAGGSSSHVAKSVRRISARQVYLRFQLKMSANWQGHEAGDNKIFYLTDSGTGGGGDPIYISALGGGNGTLQLSIVNQGSGSTRYRSSTAGNQVSGDATIPRGQWVTIEVLIQGNTPGSNNGQIHAWVNGQKVMQFSNITMMAAGTSGLFDSLRWEPIWGGQGSRNVEQTMSQSIDHIYVSGR